MLSFLFYFMLYFRSQKSLHAFPPLLMALYEEFYLLLFFFLIIKAALFAFLLQFQFYLINYSFKVINLFLNEYFD